MDRFRAETLLRRLQVESFADREAFRADVAAILDAWPGLACPNCAGSGCDQCDDLGLACPVCRNATWVRATRNPNYLADPGARPPRLMDCPECVTRFPVNGEDMRHRDGLRMVEAMVRFIRDAEPVRNTVADDDVVEAEYVDAAGNPVPF